MLPIILITVIFAYFIYAIHKLDLHRPAMEALCKPVGEWFGEAGNPVRTALWVGAIVLSLASWLSPANTLFNQMLPDFISISIAVIVIDELVQYRNDLQHKQQIFEQVQSRVRDVAVEALRIAIQNGWLGELIKINKLVGGQFEGADLSKAQLQGANLLGTNLQGANLSGANLQGVNLLGTNLQGANLSGANLQEAELLGANLQGANLSEANLQGTDLWLANLQEAELRNANLKESHLSQANLQRANLQEANLQQAHLSQAKLQGAELRNANLQGSYLVSVKLDGAFYNDSTVWPEGFDPEVAGAIFKEYDYYSGFYQESN